MKKRILTAIAVLLLPAMLFGCAAGTQTDKSLVYTDMQTAFEKSGLRSANIGIFSRTEADGAVTYGECGSGVIFQKENGAYYALTAAHVVSVENAQLLVFTVNTDMRSESIPGLDSFTALDPAVYDTMYPAQVVFVSDRDDLAVIRFACGETLSVIEFADEDPVKGDRILCVGNPQNEWFLETYGEVLSDVEVFGASTGFPSNAMRHSAYIQVGSSGGAALNEEMKLVGITPGAAISPNGKTVKYGVLIPIGEIRACIVERYEQLLH